MHVVVVTEKNGKIELTKDELQKMLDESYNNGYSKGYTDGIRTTTITTTPNYPFTYDKWTITACNHSMYDFTTEESEQYHKDITKQCDKIGVNIFDLTGR